MVYNKCTFLDCYSVFSPLHAYFMPTHGNEEVLVLGKLPCNKCKDFWKEALHHVGRISPYTCPHNKNAEIEGFYF
jgi:hypothetical protein